MSQHVVPTKVYFTVFALLLVFTFITVLAAQYDFGVLNVAVAVGIAIFKASLVVLFFMHVKYSERLVQLTVAGAFLWLLILLGITLSDYVSRDWLKIPGV